MVGEAGVAESVKRARTAPEGEVVRAPVGTSSAPRMSQKRAWTRWDAGPAAAMMMSSARGGEEGGGGGSVGRRREEERGVRRGGGEGREGEGAGCGARP